MAIFKQMVIASLSTTVLLLGLIFSSSASSESVSDNAFVLRHWQKSATEQAKQRGENSAIITFDGVAYQRADILRDFLNIAFSDSFWIEDETIVDDYRELFAAMMSRLPQSSHKDAPGGRKPSINALWLQDYLLREPGDLPRHGALAKWTTEVTIGIDWPRYESFSENISSETPYQSWASDGLIESYTGLQKHIERFIPTLNELTGLKVRFVAPDAPEDKSPSFARIRIVPVKSTSPIAKPTFSAEPVPSQTPHFREYEYRLLGRVPFTPKESEHVAGYLLPNSDNSIGMAICKINPSVSEDLLQRLIGECLVRALGLPTLSTASSKTLLGPRNDLSVDGSRTAVEITPYDQTMIKLLYCPSLTPGMDKQQVFAFLAKPNKCLN